MSSRGKVGPSEFLFEYSLFNSERT